MLNMSKKLPKEVTICGIGYRVTEIDGMIIFSESSGFYGCCNRMIFTRNQYSGWRIELKLTFDNILTAHIEKAYHLIMKWRGDDWFRPYKEENKNE